MPHNKKIKMPHAFLVLGIEPYLYSDENDQAWLQKHFVQLTRKFHPDLLPYGTSDEQREFAESQLAEINAAYLSQKDLKRRLNLLFESLKNSDIVLETNSKSNKLPPDYALRYFEIQELIESDPDSSSTQKELSSFQSEMQSYSSQIGKNLEDISKKYPFHQSSQNSIGKTQQSGIFVTETANKTWSLDENDLKDLSRLYDQKKYVDRLLQDLQNNFVVAS